MNKTEIELRRKARLEEWKLIIQEFQQSGLSVSQFCKEKNLCDKTFYRYQKLIREEFVAAHPDLVDSMTNRKSRLAAPAAADHKSERFAALDPRQILDASSHQEEVLPAAPVISTDSSYTVEQIPALKIEANGVVISIANHADPSLVSAVLGALIC